MKIKRLINLEPLKKAAFPMAFIAATFVTAAACSDSDDPVVPDDPDPVVVYNPARYITDEAKLAMLHSLKDIDGNGRLYELNYTADYKLDQVINAGITETKALFTYIGSLLYDNLSTKAADVTFGSGCSAFAVPSGSDFLMGRNYDFRHSEDSVTYIPISAFVVHTAPEGGKKSISMVDGLNIGYGQGFYTDGTTDLSLLMGLPYAALDGINEDGFAIGVLALNEKQTKQNTGKTKISTTVAIRMLLDRASTVKEALRMLQEYDMDMEGQGKSNYHFFMADATGDYAIVEYAYKNKGDDNPTEIKILSDNDTLRCVTNFYVTPAMVGTKDGWGSDHGKKRYFTMRDTLAANNYKLREEQAWVLLDSVSQPPTKEITSQTQWSSLFNLTEKTFRLSILREYAKEYNFKVE